MKTSLSPGGGEVYSYECYCSTAERTHTRPHTRKKIFRMTSKEQQNCLAECSEEENAAGDGKSKNIILYSLSREEIQFISHFRFVLLLQVKSFNTSGSGVETSDLTLASHSFITVFILDNH